MVRESKEPNLRVRDGKFESYKSTLILFLFDKPNIKKETFLSNKSLSL